MLGFVLQRWILLINSTDFLCIENNKALNTLFPQILSQILQEPWGHHRFKYQTTLLEYRNKIDRNKNGTSLYQKIFFSLYMYMTFNFNYVLNCGHSSDTLNSNFSSFSTCYRSNQSELLQTGLYNYSCKISYM